MLRYSPAECIVYQWWEKKKICTSMKADYNYHLKIEANEYARQKLQQNKEGKRMGEETRHKVADGSG
jgi:hypothetical protein